MPRATIAIPNYNMERYIGEALESAVAQTVQDIEIVVVDNNSTDGSWDVIDEWRKRDARIRALDFDDHVLSLENWNRCLENAQSEYIVFLHADDRLKPDYIEKCLKVYERHPELGYVFGEKDYIDENGVLSKAQIFYDQSGVIPGYEEARVNLLGWHTAPVQMLIRTECMRAIGGYRYSDTQPVLLLNLRWDVGYISEPIVEYRKHDAASSSQLVRDKCLIMILHLTKMTVLNNFLPPEAAYLADLKPQINARTAHACLSVYAMQVLGNNQNRLCREYMQLAKGFCLDVEESALYSFLEKASKKSDWNAEKLSDAWNSYAPRKENAGPPYPLPEGSTPLDL